MIGADMLGRSKRRAIWTEVANEVGGQHHLPARWWQGDEYITATIAGVEVKLDTFMVSTGKTSQTYTRIAARIAHGPGVKSQCYRQGFWATIGKLVGMQDLTLGDAAFDKDHVVRTENLAVVRRWWTDRTRALMSTIESARLTTDVETVKLVGGGRWRDVTQMVSGLRLVGELAARDLYGAGMLQAVGGAFSYPAGERPRIELDTGRRVVVMAEDRDDRLVISARVSDPVAHEPLVIEIVDGRADLATKLSQGAQVHLANVGSGQLRIGETSALLWNDFETDPARLMAGAQLLGAIDARGGVYR